jgi:hypothetical protein
MGVQSIWATIDPSSTFKPATTGGYTDTSATPAAATSAGFGTGAPAYSPKHKHFGFAVVLLLTGGLIYWTYEGKPSGARASANLGPVGAGGDVTLK